MTTFITIVLIGLLIGIHEFGHFLVAKLAGVKVLRFSIGFGPRLAARRRGETEYLLSLIPLGGYVQLLNEPPADPGEAARDQGRSLAEKPPGWRAAIFAAGPAMNLLLPFLLLPLVYFVGIQAPAYRLEPPRVGHVSAESPAAAAGVTVGDLVLAVDGRPVATWQELAARLEQAGGEPPVLQVTRGAAQLDLRFAADGGGGQGFGLAPPLPPVIGAVSPGSPAARAGLAVSDRILAVDGREVSHWYQFTAAIEEGAGAPLVLQVRRGGELVEVQVQPAREGERYLIGVTMAQATVTQRHSPIEALELGGRKAIGLIGATLAFLGDLFGGDVDSNQVGGPVAVFQMTGAAVATSLADTLLIVAFLSIQLGILNLLPVPVLDGGHLLLLGAEVLCRRPLPARLREGLQGIGLVLVLGLMVFSFYNDLSRLL